MAATIGTPQVAAPADTRSALHDLLTAGTQPAQIVAFYKDRDFEPAWTGDDGALAHAAQVRDLLQHAEEQGLRSEDYASWKRWSDVPTDPAEAARYDIALTRAFLVYVWDVRIGRFKPADVYKDVKLPGKTLDVAGQVNIGLSHRTLDSFLAALPPPNPGYRALTAALAHYRAIAEQGSWPTVAAGSTKSLAKRLAVEDPILAANAHPSDGDVTKALLRYEDRNGFEQSGDLSPDVIASLNVPVQTRIQQIAANLERLRWIPEKLERRYISVNVPDQSVDFVRKGKIVLHSKVIIGKPDTPTPILKTVVQSVVVNPPWDIPDFIAAKSLLPHLRKDKNYLQTKNIILADGPADDPYGQKINWHKVTANTIPYQIQQQPGADNALGKVMLDMPNDFDVYLHDTPHKELFQADMREKSNGCIRTEQIMALASLVITDDAEDGLTELNNDIATGKTQHLALDDPMPVYLFYWTAIPQPDGTVGFRPDRYGRDKQLIALMNGGSTNAKPAAKPSSKKPKTTRISSAEKRKVAATD